MSLPTFIVIGAGKCGTTSLHHYLGQHPEVVMSNIKETNFFVFDGETPEFTGPYARLLVDTSVKSLAEYEAQFENDSLATARGEISPRYLHWPGVPERIKCRIPDVKLIMFARQPVKRAFSAWVARKRDGREPLQTFEEAIEAEPRRIENNWTYGTDQLPGFYYRHLSRWLEHFGRSQFMIIPYEDVCAKPHDVIESIFGFIGVNVGFRPELNHRHNVSGIIQNPLKRLLWTRTGAIKNIVRPWLPPQLRHAVFEWFTTDVKKPAISAASYNRLLEAYRDDIIAFRKLSGLELADWLEPMPVKTTAEGSIVHAS